MVPVTRAVSWASRPVLPLRRRVLPWLRARLSCTSRTSRLDPLLSGFGVILAKLVQRDGEFGDFLAQWVFRGGVRKWCTLVATLRDLAPAIGQSHLDADFKAFAKAFDAAFPIQIGELWGAVEAIAQFFDRQFLELEGAFEAQCVLRRAHVEFQGAEINLRRGQHG